MCGIVGYIGSENYVQKILIEGLKNLEYRGYDSAGIHVGDEHGNFKSYKTLGNISNLEKTIDINSIGSIGIAHTRWATHGKPSVINCHPHNSHSNRFSIVHNGIIENYEQIKNTYLSNVNFRSDTDTEVLVQLIEFISVSEPNLSTLEILNAAMKLIKGSYAFGLIDSFEPNCLYAVKNKSPLLIGTHKDFNMIGSDIFAFIDFTNKYYELNDQEIAVLKKDHINFYSNNLTRIKKEVLTSSLNKEMISKNNFASFMEKEIHDQVQVIQNLCNIYSNNGQTIFDEFLTKELQNASKIAFVSAGTSYNASLVGKNLFEKILNKSCDVYVASEFAYNMPIISKDTFFIFLSQSGETADSLACLKLINSHGYSSLAITNVQNSSLARMATYKTYLYAGPEIAVASTKAYSAQITLMSLLCSHLNPSFDWNIKNELEHVSHTIQNLLSTENKLKIEKIVKKNLLNCQHAFYIGRGINYYLSLEAALKLKEISYIHTEGFAAGELKHGTIALIENNVPVIALISGSNHIGQVIRSNIEEVKARGANVITIVTDNLATKNDSIIINNSHELLNCLTLVVPTQLIALYAAKHLKKNIDQPRNLAKSVTVE